MHPSTRALSKILPRSALPTTATVLSPALPSLNRSKQPTIIDKLIAQKAAALEAGRPYPPNLRVEPFKDIRATWAGVSREVRRELKSLIKEK